jgi:transmembrane sensor
MSRKPPQPDETIADEAAEFIVNGEEPETADEQQLVAWLSDSPRHVGEYMRMSALWEVLADPRLDLAAPAGRAVSRRAWWAAAAAAVIGLALGTTWWISTRPEVHRTTVGEVTSFPLPDRSVVFLNADSRISVHYSDAQRRVVLHSGEAVFEVASDAERPFVVVCGATRVTAVGTKFAVGRRSGQTTVTLIEGKIVVAGPLAIAPAHTRLGEGRSTVALAPGQQLTTEDSGLTTITTVDLRQVAPWRHRRLVFDSEPLAEVAAAFNRFNQTPVRIEGEALRELRISGVFAANDPDSLLAYLRTLDGVEVRIEPDGSATVRRR